MGGVFNASINTNVDHYTRGHKVISTADHLMTSGIMTNIYSGLQSPLKPSPARFKKENLMPVRVFYILKNAIYVVHGMGVFNAQSHKHKHKCRSLYPRAKGDR